MEKLRISNFSFPNRLTRYLFLSGAVRENRKARSRRVLCQLRAFDRCCAARTYVHNITFRSPPTHISLVKFKTSLFYVIILLIIFGPTSHVTTVLKINGAAGPQADVHAVTSVCGAPPFTDVNECQDPSYCRNGRCENTPGSFHCFCDPPLTFSAALKQCVYDGG